MLRRLIVATTLVATFVPMVPAHATNGYWSSWRRWPWVNGTTRTLTQVDGHTYASASARRALDIGMSYETVVATLPGVVHDAGSGGAAGVFVMVQGDDGSFYTYEHLSSAQHPVGTRVMLGDPIAVSGNSGNSSGPHLHLQRAEGPSFQSAAMSLFPISGVASATAGSSYLSDNAGIGRTSTQAPNAAIRGTYEAGGGYAQVGIPVAILTSWMPCRYKAVAQTRWLYRCLNGLVQTYRWKDEWRALMAADGASVAQVVPQPFLAAYTELHQGKDWVAYIGYPTEPVTDTAPRVKSQRYERGRITVDVHRCRTTVTSETTTVRYENWC